MSPSPPLLARIEQHGERTALGAEGMTYSYRQLSNAAARLAAELMADAGELAEGRVALLAPPGFSYVAALCGIWQAGGVAVPLCLQHPPPEWAFALDDARAAAIVVHPDYEERIRPLVVQRSLRVVTPARCAEESPGARVATMKFLDDPATCRALILYTSGTTGKPKGVVTTHANLAAQVQSLVDAWAWTPADRILHALPLHHVHGIVNALLCALWSGATCELLPRFDAVRVWERLASGELTLFMGVPTMYAKLIAAWEQAAPPERQAWSAGAARLRLMVSGSAALPVSTLEAWRALTGHVLLERYGMTEIGMVLSNPLHGLRRPGCVGAPLPGVEVRLVDEQGQPLPEGRVGEIEVRGPNVFLEYWQRPAETGAAFRDGWFRSGDAAIVETGSYRILGRQSVDILKTGGYKVSALEIEEVLRTHPAIRDCAVVGIPDADWGDRVTACVVLHADQALTLAALRDWAKERLAAYKLPRQLKIMAELPRNALGKVQKPALIAQAKPEA